MNNNNAPRWSRTTGENLSTPFFETFIGRDKRMGQIEHSPVGRRFRFKPMLKLGEKAQRMRTYDTFVILSVHPETSNPNSFTQVKARNENTGDVFYTRLAHKGTYYVPENQK